MLTESEHAALEASASLYNLIVRKVFGSGPGSARVGDLSELAFYIHGIQNMILAQSAAREYPDKYRLLGD